MEYVEIGLTCSGEVNICGIRMNGTQGLENGLYYCLGEAVIQCDRYNNYQTTTYTKQLQTDSTDASVSGDATDSTKRSVALNATIWNNLIIIQLIMTTMILFASGVLLV